VTTNDVSPYLLRPVRKLAEAIAEAEQQRLETSGPPVTEPTPEKSDEAMPRLAPVPDVTPAA
jgi:hypothetical protein